MVSFLKTDNYGHIQQVFLGPCICECCNIKLSNDQVHDHKIETIEDEHRYVRRFMRRAKQQGEEQEHG